MGGAPCSRSRATAPPAADRDRHRIAEAGRKSDSRDRAPGRARRRRRRACARSIAPATPSGSRAQAAGDRGHDRRSRTRRRSRCSAGGTVATNVSASGGEDHSQGGGGIPAREPRAIQRTATNPATPAIAGAISWPWRATAHRRTPRVLRLAGVRGSATRPTRLSARAGGRRWRPAGSVGQRAVTR